MKTKNNILSLLMVSIAMLLSTPNCMALKGEPPDKAVGETCPPPVTTDITVKLLNDCNALQNCHFEILVFDQSGCAVETQPIASKDYTYGFDTQFTGLTFYEAKVKVCVRLKPGQSCSEPITLRNVYAVTYRQEQWFLNWIFVIHDTDNTAWFLTLNSISCRCCDGLNPSI